MTNDSFFFRAWLFVTALSALWVCHSGIARAQQDGVVSHTFQGADHAPGPNTPSGWWYCKPVRSVDPSQYGSILADIDSHMPAGHKYRDPDVITWGHETTHAINNDVRNTVGTGVNAFYVLNDNAFVVREPRFPRHVVAERVPNEYRGDDIWGLYMASRSNDDTPLYIIDEWTAYINGAMVAQELYGAARTDQTGRLLGVDTEHALKFAVYATALLECVDAYDPTYPDRAKLIEFIGHEMDRTIALTAKHPQPQLIQVFSQRYWQGGQQQCVDGSCGTPKWNGQQWYRQPTAPAKPAVVAKPPAVVATPPLAPVTPPVNGCKCDNSKPCNCGEGAACKCDPKRIALLEAEIKSLKTLAATAQEAFDQGKLKGAKGDPGPAGVVGPQGPKGEPGPPGKDAEPIDPKTIAADVHKKLTLSMKTSQQGAFGRYALIAAAGAAASAGGIFVLRKNK